MSVIAVPETTGPDVVWGSPPMLIVKDPQETDENTAKKPIATLQHDSLPISLDA